MVASVGDEEVEKYSWFCSSDSFPNKSKYIKPCDFSLHDKGGCGCEVVYLGLRSLGQVLSTSNSKIRFLLLPSHGMIRRLSDSYRDLT